ncbi:MAG: cysteine--tRNA ligase [Magnetococcales bacterium]|nr:cysteine--tRNA ligase [Magnetococcales bacterium]
MTIQIYNTMTRRKEPLQLRQPGHVGLYVCGMTVYDRCHIGHARVMVVFDMMVRYLRATGLQVRYVRNFTDIDDKIIRRAGELAISIEALTGRYIQAFQQDMAALAVLPADIEPRATDHIADMQQLIGRLLANGLAYQSDGDVLFSVDRCHHYGQLSGKSLTDLEAGSRVTVNEHKHNPLDFVLWKAAKAGEPYWPSPWGDGRPGWHIECSAMSMRYLGEQFDIHGGGLDLVFPHHENEIAQSEGSVGCHPWVRHWVHNGFVNVVAADGQREKMSKSLGNFLTIEDLLQHYPGETIRLFILNSHYRSPLDFSYALLAAAQAAMDRIYGALRAALPLTGDSPCEPVAEPLDQSDRETKRFLQAMNDDFNSSQALAVLFELVRQLNSAVTQRDRALACAMTGQIRRLGTVLGLVNTDVNSWFQRRPSLAAIDAAEIERLVCQRNEARQGRRFAEADQIRQALTDLGVILQDSASGTSWSWQR